MEKKFLGGEPKEEERTYLELSPLSVAILMNDKETAERLAGLKEEPEDWRERACTWRPSLEGSLPLEGIIKAERAEEAIRYGDLQKAREILGFDDPPHPLPLSTKPEVKDD